MGHRDTISRPDAALVYRSLRDVGDQNVEQLARSLFPWPDYDGSSAAAIKKNSVKRAFEAIRYIRAHGTGVFAYAGEEMSVFSLSRRVVDPRRVVRVVKERVPLLPVGEKRDSVVTDKVAQPIGDLMGVWHEGSE